MYALRTQNWAGQHYPSGVADGMFLKKDGTFTDSKASAILFDSGVEAEAFIENVVKPEWLKQSPDNSPDEWNLADDGQVIPLFLVQVITKPVIAKVGQTVKVFR